MFPSSVSHGRIPLSNFLDGMRKARPRNEYHTFQLSDCSEVYYQETVDIQGVREFCALSLVVLEVDLIRKLTNDGMCNFRHRCWMLGSIQENVVHLHGFGEEAPDVWEMPL